MNNTEKLLRAFIEASGYDVELVNSPAIYKEISRGDGLQIIRDTPKAFGSKGNDLLIDPNGAYKRGDNGSYFNMLGVAAYDYRVTKKVEIDSLLSDKAKSIPLYMAGDESIESDGVFENIDNKSETYRDLRFKNLQMSEALLLIKKLDHDNIFDAPDIAKEALECNFAQDVANTRLDSFESKMCIKE